LRTSEGNVKTCRRIGHGDREFGLLSPPPTDILQPGNPYGGAEGSRLAQYGCDRLLTVLGQLGMEKEDEQFTTLMRSMQHLTPRLRYAIRAEVQTIVKL